MKCMKWASIYFGLFPDVTMQELRRAEDFKYCCVPLSNALRPLAAAGPALLIIGFLFSV